MTPQEIATDKIAQEWIGRPFKLGSDDCAHLVMAMRAEIGAPISFKGGAKYSTEAGAIRALRKLGYNDLDQRLQKAWSLFFRHSGMWTSKLAKAFV